MQIPDPKHSVRAGFDELLVAIRHCAERELTTPALILLYSAIDIAGWLDADADTTSGETFTAWANRYLLPARPTLECTADDLWGARCGLVHMMSPDSSHSAKGKARKIYYASGDDRPAPLKEMLKAFRDPRPERVVVVRVNDLVAALGAAVNTFLAEVEADPRRLASLRQKAMPVFMSLTREDVIARVRIARDALGDIEPI